MQKIIAVSIISIFLFTGCSNNEYTPLVQEVDGQNLVCDPNDSSGCVIDEDKTVGYEVGQQIPNLQITDYDGNTYNLYDLVIGHDRFVLNFSTYWCPDCSREKEKMDIAFQEFGDSIGYAVVYVNIPSHDTPDMTNEEILQNTEDYLAENAYTFPTYYDYDDEYVDLFGIQAIPYNIILDENAVITAKSQEIDFDNLLSENKDQINPQLNGIY